MSLLRGQVDRPAYDMETRRNPDGTLDEVFLRDVKLVHVEQMDTGHWWIAAHLADGSQVMLNFVTRRPASTVITLTCERDA